MQIEMRDICKAFGANTVLNHASFFMKSGEIHALMGENGAGKSTLMNILTGVHKKDSGMILVDDREVCYRSPQEAEKGGIVFIHQELNVLYDLTVEENMFLGKELQKAPGICDRKAMQRRAGEVLKGLGVEISPQTRMCDLSVGQQQMVEIAKAFMVDAKAIIMDEPTAALTQSETELLFQVVKRLKKQGVSIIYISHRMEEIFELCDRVTVLRDGAYIGTREMKDTDMNEVVKMMIGREIGERFPHRNAELGETVFEVKGFSSKGTFSDISFQVKRGEVLGVAGLMGAGRTEIMQAIFGNFPLDAGSVYLDGQQISIKSPQEAMQHGIGFITEDRKQEGLMLEDSIMKNISIANLQRISRHGILRRRAERELTMEGIRELNIKCGGPQTEVGTLSGGNQQKVIFAKWIDTKPRVLILDEPTRGVDIGAKKEIYTIINKLAAEGMAIIMVSSELPELLGMSDRIMVIHEGRIGGIIEKQEACQENVMVLATGGKIDGK